MLLTDIKRKLKKMIKYLKNDLEQEIGSGRVLVDFYADWCGPCRMMGTVLEEISGIDILKVNVDKHPLVAQKYGVISIPALFLFENGKIIKNSVGFMEKESLINFIM